METYTHFFNGLWAHRAARLADLKAHLDAIVGDVLPAEYDLIEATGRARIELEHAEAIMRWMESNLSDGKAKVMTCQASFIES